MKKFFSIFFALIYLATSTGLALQVHHCMGKSAGLSLISSSQNKCGECGMTKGKNACCKDEVKFVKLQDSHKLLYANFELPIPEAIINNTYHINDVSLVNRISPLVNLHSPPNSGQPSLCILHCVFRVWYYKSNDQLMIIRILNSNLLNQDENIPYQELNQTRSHRCYYP